jgi:hypothetical protein
MCTRTIQTSDVFTLEGKLAKMSLEALSTLTFLIEREVM